MKSQVSMKALLLRIEWLNKALGRPLEPWTKTEQGCKANVGNFHLDKCLGGYRVEEQLPGGGSHPIFGHKRQSKADLLNKLEAILQGIALAREPLAKALDNVIEDLERNAKRSGPGPDRRLDELKAEMVIARRNMRF